MIMIKKIPVVSLTKVSKETRVAGCHDDATEILFLECSPCRVGRLESAFYVDRLNYIPILLYIITWLISAIPLQSDTNKLLNNLAKPHFNSVVNTRR